mgnify:CR=1 FL=1
MSQPVEVRLRVPNMKVRVLDETGYPIDHSAMRFRKVLEVPKIPKPEEPVELMTNAGRVIHARVVRSDGAGDHEVDVPVEEVESGAVLGSRGFGLARGPTGWEELPQTGTVELDRLQVLGFVLGGTTGMVALGLFFLPYLVKNSCKCFFGYMGR